MRTQIFFGTEALAKLSGVSSREVQKKLKRHGVAPDALFCTKGHRLLAMFSEQTVERLKPLLKIKG